MQLDFNNTHYLKEFKDSEFSIEIGGEKLHFEEDSLVPMYFKCGDFQVSITGNPRDTLLEILKYLHIVRGRPYPHSYTVKQFGDTF